MTAGRKRDERHQLPAISACSPKDLSPELKDVPPSSGAMVALRKSKRKPTALLRKDTLAAARKRIAEALSKNDAPDEFEVTTTTWKVERVKSRVRAVRGKDGKRRPGLLAHTRNKLPAVRTEDETRRPRGLLAKDSARSPVDGGRTRRQDFFHRERTADCTTDEAGSKWRLKERFNAAMRQEEEKTAFMRQAERPHLLSAD